MVNKFDEKISKMLNEDIYIPQKITNRIKISLKEEKKGAWLNMKLNKVLATTMAVITISTGIVFAGKTIIDYRNSLKIAKEHSYFENLDIDYVYNNGLGIKIENYFLDQARAGVTINIKSDKEIESAEIYSTDIAESNTWSETIDGKVYIHWDESERGLEFNKRFNLIKFVDENGKESFYDQDSVGGYGPALEEYEKIDNNTVRTLYTMPVYGEVTESKMKVSIKRVMVYYKDGSKKEHIGNWEFEINISDKYLTKSDNVKYNGTVNLENVTVEKAELSATKLIVTLKTDNLEELLYGKYAQYNEYGDKMMLYEFPRLFGSEGEYKSEEVNAERSNYYDKNEMTFKFDISKFTAEDSYKIIMPVTNQGDSEIVIMLNK